MQKVSNNMRYFITILLAFLIVFSYLYIPVAKAADIGEGGPAKKAYVLGENIEYNFKTENNNVIYNAQNFVVSKIIIPDVEFKIKDKDGKEIKITEGVLENPTSDFSIECASPYSAQIIGEAQNLGKCDLLVSLSSGEQQLLGAINVSDGVMVQDDTGLADNLTITGTPNKQMLNTDGAFQYTIEVKDTNTDITAGDSVTLDFKGLNGNTDYNFTHIQLTGMNQFTEYQAKDKDGNDLTERKGGLQDLYLALDNVQEFSITLYALSDEATFNCNALLSGTVTKNGVEDFGITATGSDGSDKTFNFESIGIIEFIPILWDSNYDVPFDVGTGENETVDGVPVNWTGVGNFTNADSVYIGSWTGEANEVLLETYEGASFVEGVSTGATLKDTISIADKQNSSVEIGDNINYIRVVFKNPKSEIKTTTQFKILNCQAEVNPIVYKGFSPNAAIIISTYNNCNVIFYRVYGYNIELNLTQSANEAKIKTDVTYTVNGSNIAIDNQYPASLKDGELYFDLNENFIPQKIELGTWKNYTGNVTVYVKRGSNWITIGEGSSGETINFEDNQNGTRLRIKINGDLPNNIEIKDLKLIGQYNTVGNYDVTAGYKGSAYIPESVLNNTGATANVSSTTDAQPITITKTAEPTPTPTPTSTPTVNPNPTPSANPTTQPSSNPTVQPSSKPTAQPTTQPSSQPTTATEPSAVPTETTESQKKPIFNNFTLSVSNSRIGYGDEAVISLNGINVSNIGKGDIYTISIALPKGIQVMSVYVPQFNTQTSAEVVYKNGVRNLGKANVQKTYNLSEMEGLNVQGLTLKSSGSDAINTSGAVKLTVKNISAKKINAAITAVGSVKSSAGMQDAGYTSIPVTISAPDFKALQDLKVSNNKNRIKNSLSVIDEDEDGDSSGSNSSSKKKGSSSDIIDGDESSQSESDQSGANRGDEIVILDDGTITVDGIPIEDGEVVYDDEGNAILIGNDGTPVDTDALRDSYYGRADSNIFDTVVGTDGTETIEVSEKMTLAAVNLVCAIACLIIGLYLLSEVLKHKPIDLKNKLNIIRLLSLVPMAIAIVIFIMNDNITGKIVILDRWSLLMIVLTCASAALLIVSKMMPKDKNSRNNTPKIKREKPVKTKKNTKKSSKINSKMSEKLNKSSYQNDRNNYKDDFENENLDDDSGYSKSNYAKMIRNRDYNNRFYND